MLLGGTYVAKDKTKKLINVDGDIVPVGSGIFSVRYHQDFRLMKERLHHLSFNFIKVAFLEGFCTFL